MSLLSSVIWRVIAALGILLSAFAEAALLEQTAGNNGSHSHNSAGPVGVNVTAFYKNSGQVLTIPLKRVDHRGVATPSIAKRFFKTDVLGVFGAAYLAELTIGTSTTGTKQTVDVLIDTGSFELWVNPDCDASNVPQFCEAFGHYDPSQSTTAYKILDDGFDITYGSGEAQGAYYKDDVYISGAKIEQQQFGVANSSDLVWFGIMGLAHGQGNGFIEYPLIIDSLSAQGFTNTKFFSLDLGGQVAPGAAVTGEMVFGGVDTNKYAGLLQKVPTDPSDPHYKITLNGIAHRGPGSTVATPFADANLPLAAIVDSGTTLSLLPESVVSKLAAQFPGAESDGDGGYRVDCAFQDRDGSVDFLFGGVTISVAYRDFIWNSGGDCFLGAWSSNDLGVWILGDTFLRGAYVTFDQTNNALFMANYVSCNGGQSNLVAVPAGPNAAANIPGSCPGAIVPSVSSLPASSSIFSTSVTSATFPDGTVSSTIIPSLASSLGQTLNPVVPASSTTTGSLSTSPPLVVSSSTPPSSVLVVSSTPGISSPTLPSSIPGAPIPPSSNPGGSIPPTPATVALNNPTDIPPGAPAQGGPDPDGVGGIGADAGAGTIIIASISPTPSPGPGTGTGTGAGADAGAIDGTDPTTGLPVIIRPGPGEPPDEIPTTTVTSTITRAIVYTVTTCAESHPNCALGQVATRFETVVTTFCPGHEDATFTSLPAVTAAAGGIIGVSESSAPGVSLGDTGSQEEGGGGQIPIPTPLITTTAYPTTTIYEVMSCPPTNIAEETCTVGMTTTRVVTVVETISVQPVSASASVAPGNQYAPAGYSSSNSTTVNGVGAEGSAAVFVAGAAPAAVGGGLLDRRHLGAAFAVIWGIMVLL
ncbi:acid protease [Xylariaceae sp. AK1471]|nr:acid protease [Xylariaceae sp. AK1471]